VKLDLRRWVKSVAEIGRALGHTHASTKSGVTAGYIHKKK
jgi:hypothetical protein